MVMLSLQLSERSYRRLLIGIKESKVCENMINKGKIKESKVCENMINKGKIKEKG
jgi:hypothetical protein